MANDTVTSQPQVSVSGIISEATWLKLLSESSIIQIGMPDIPQTGCAKCKSAFSLEISSNCITITTSQPAKHKQTVEKTER